MSEDFLNLAAAWKDLAENCNVELDEGDRRFFYCGAAALAVVLNNIEERYADNEMARSALMRGISMELGKFQRELQATAEEAA